MATTTSEILRIVLDPLHGDGYQFWSGIGAAAFIPTIIYLTPTRCEQLGCMRKARTRHLGSGLALCHKHLPKE